MTEDWSRAKELAEKLSFEYDREDRGGAQCTFAARWIVEILEADAARPSAGPTAGV